METASLHPTRCAICGTEGNASEVYPEYLDLSAFNPTTFSARRAPDRIHYRIVKCNDCGLVRSDPIGDPELLTHLYAQSTFDYADEVANLKRTYGRYLACLDGYGAQKGALLEIGCGNGFFLEEALSRGYGTVRGVEPSSAAVQEANPSVRPSIVCDIMRPSLFAAEEFDVICLFQVLNHVSELRALIDECVRILRPNGLVLCIDHDVESLSARVLRERSPIVDIEHTYLFSRSTITKVFAAAGLRVRRVGTAVNTYSLYYLFRSAPLPARVKTSVLAVLAKTPLGRIAVSMRLGNLYLVAQKPGR